MLQHCSSALQHFCFCEAAMYTPIISNIIVALIILLLIGFAIRTLHRQGKKENCASCGTKKNSACKGCKFADSCH
ncbi:MAG TPA: hypothetical protein DD633_10090 [Sphaerochaeta sp.]|nr:hypothetical protein [Sphaerochaeta sp.]HBO36877.1 hypothetical protein [Sphaerochaeta sp.]